MRLPQPTTPQSPSTDDFSDIAQAHDAGDDFSDIAEPHTSSLETLTANPKKQGTYRLLPPAGSDVKSGVMIPYGNVRTALQQGFGFDPGNGDDTRYAHDLFTELSGKGQAPTVESPDEPLMDQYGVIPTPAPGTKEWYKRGGRKLEHFGVDSLPTAGAIAGGAVTSEGIVTAGIGAGIGASYGEAARQLLNKKLFGEKLTPEESRRQLALQGAIGTTLEIGGRVVAKPLSKVADYLGYTAKASEKAGFRMLPSEAMGTKASVFETYPKGSIFTSNTMARWRELQNKETEQAAQKLANDISTKSLSKTGSREEAGKIIRYGIENQMTAFSNSQNLIYRQIEKQADAAGVQVPRKDMVDFAKKELGRINRVKGETGGGGPTDSLKNLLNDIINNPNQYASYAAMKDFRTSLLAEARSDKSLLSAPEQGWVEEMAKKVGKSIEDGLKAKSPSLAAAWRSANDVTREEKQKFVEKLVKNLADKKNPEDIALVLRGNSPSAIAPIGIQETRDAMSIIPKAMIPRVQKQILLDTMYEATGKGTQAFDEGVFAKKILQVGDERGEVLFGKNWGKVKEFSELLNKMREKGGLSAANLSNPEVVKQVWTQVGRMAAESIGSVIGSRAAGGSALADIGWGLFPLASEATLWKTVAAALTHPEAAAKLVEKMATSARVAPYLAASSYNAVKKINPERGEKIKGFIKESVTPTPKPAAPTPAPPSSGGQAYTHVAVNPSTGHSIGSNDGKTWFDVATGQPIQ